MVKHQFGPQLPRSSASALTRRPFCHSSPQHDRQRACGASAALAYVRNAPARRRGISGGAALPGLVAGTAAPHHPALGVLGLYSLGSWVTNYCCSGV